MAALPQQKSDKMTEAEYLEFERASEMKHEYLYGDVFAMVGASRAHNLINVNLIRLISTHLRGKKCESYASDMKVKVEATKLYTYPDFVVACGDAEFVDDEFDTLLNPVVIIEVLSPSTELYDRGEKFAHYRQIPSLREYLLVLQEKPRIEHYLRKDSGKWEFSDAKGLDSKIELPSIDCTLALAEVYEQVTFAEQD